ncbi:MAG: superoxide dismutase family protein [Myxococcales bacterium]|nr:superoxide dismutase family protein [Myxococcales bacterium]
MSLAHHDIVRCRPPDGGPVSEETLDGTASSNVQVHISGRVTGLSKGQHGFHIHESGDCSAPDAKSAGVGPERVVRRASLTLGDTKWPKQSATTSSTACISGASSSSTAIPETASTA